jgi:hypothetical protein
MTLEAMLRKGVVERTRPDEVAALRMLQQAQEYVEMLVPRTSTRTSPTTARTWRRSKPSERT